jgi:hypothetical protein
MQSPAFEESAISSHEAPTSSPGASACSLSGMELVVENDLNFCRRRAVDFARRDGQFILATKKHVGRWLRWHRDGQSLPAPWGALIRYLPNFG